MNESISGSTRLVGFFASPHKHTLSPLIHNTAFNIKEINAVYLAFDVDEKNIRQALASIKTLNMLGANISMPNKQTACLLVDKLSDNAKLAGSINVITNQNGHLVGHNSDGIGFIKSLDDLNFSIKDKEITVLGKGGASLSIIAQAAIDGAKKINIITRLTSDTRKKLEKTLTEIVDKTQCEISFFTFDDYKNQKKSIQNSQLLVNATPVGMNPKEDHLLISENIHFHKSLLVSDITYTQNETVLLKKAKKEGCITDNGISMLIHQAGVAFNLWTGSDFPINEVKKQVIEYLNSKRK